MTAYIQSPVIKADMEAFKLNFNRSANIVNPVGGVCKVGILSQVIDAKVLDNVVFIEVGEGGDDMALMFPISSSDLVAGKLLRTHNFNRDVDVSVFDSGGREQSVGVTRINLNQVEIDFLRVGTFANWRLLIE